MSHDTWAHKLVAIGVRPLVTTAVTPNQLTTARLLTGLAAFACFAIGYGGWVVLGGTIYVLSMFLDRADGQLARMTGKVSVWGHNFDIICDNIVTTLLFIGVGIGLRDSSLDWWATVMGVAAGLSVTGIFWLSDRIADHRPPGQDAIPGAGGFDPDDILFIVGPLAWFGWLEGFLIVASVGAPLFLVAVVLYYGLINRQHRSNG